LEPTNPRLEIKVSPGGHFIAVMKRVDRAASYSCTYYSSIVYSEDKLLANIKVKGKKT
jgi:hypothetical protein